MVLEKYARPACSVLVVDDDDVTRQMMREILEREGCSVVLAEDGRAALERLGPVPVDVIFLDLMMPEMDGFEFLETLRKHDNPAWRGVPVVVVTAKDLTRDERKFLNQRVETIVQKGTDLKPRDTLMAEVRKILADTVRTPMN